MRVKLAPRARQRARAINTWWQKNRPGVEGLFEQEYAFVIGKLASMSPRSPLGKVHEERRGSAIWQVFLPKTQQHLYYSVNEATETVVVRMIWGARRGRVPKF